MSKLVLIASLLAFCSPAIANTSFFPPQSSTIVQRIETFPHTPDGERFKQITQHAIAQNLSQKPIEVMMQTLAREFLGTPYQAGLLDKGSQETLITPLTQFDCVLFVETVLALVRGIALENYTYSNFTEQIINLRYRHGKMNNYCDRLHYFSEWISDNQKRGNVVNLTSALGGIPFNKTLNFMTTHRDSYPQIANQEKMYQCMAEVEQNLRQLHPTYLPTLRLKSIYTQLKSGDIIAITTNIAGLDVTHTGLVYRQGNEVGLIHASPAGRVTIAPDLQKYVSKVPKAIGIFVVRPVDPRF